MKRFYSAICIILPLFAATLAWPSCGNNRGTKSKCPVCPTKDSDCEGSNPVSVYDSNAYRGVTDLEMFGGVGQHRLAWRRHANSRFIGSQKNFGHAQNWRHGYEWTIYDSGTDSQGRALLTISYPDQAGMTFTQVSPTQWNPPPAVTERLFQNGNDFTLQQASGWQYNFTRLANGTYRMQDFTDANGNVYTFAYDQTGRLSRITEPAGRWLQITYTDINCNDVEFTTIATVSGTPPSGQWSELPVTDTRDYRYLRYLGPDGSYSSVAEIEFYGASSNKLSGAAFGTSPAWSGREYWKATDGLTNTWFSNYDKNHGFTGIDLGSGNATRISKVRFYPLSGYESRMNGGWFQGSTQPPAMIKVISRVDSSDGRSVIYDYQVLNDPAVPGAAYVMLVAANYNDGTQATYTYAQQNQGTQPTLVRAEDPRYPGVGARIIYEYTNSRMRGMIYRERNGVTTNELMRIEEVNDSTMKVTYGNGATRLYNQPSANVGNVVDKTDALGRKTSFTYTDNGTGQLQSMTDPRGKTTSYTRTPYGGLLSQTNPDNSTESWTRDNLDLVLTHTDELGRVTTYTRDAYHQVTRIDYPDGTNEQFTYNNFGQTLTHTLRNGGVEQFTYDAQGRKTSQTDPVGNVTAYGYVDTITGATNDLPLVVVDARGNATQYEYNDRGQVTKTIYPDATAQIIQYDRFGNKTNVVDELNRATAYAYDEFNRLIRVTDPLGRATVYSYDLPGGACGCAHSQDKPTKITLPSGKMTTFAYDLEWQKLSETAAFGTADAATTQYQYDSNGNLLATIDPLGRTWSQTYDDRNRRATARDPLGNITQWSYDAVGNRIRQIDGNNKYTYWTYDTMNRVTAQIRKEGDTNQQPDATDAVTSYTYDAMGNVLTVTDPNSNPTAHQYDVASRRARTTNAANEISQFFYDAVGNLVTNIAPNGNITVSLYNERNRLTHVQDSVGFVGSTTYDAKGNRLTQTDGNGNTTSFGYDAADQLITITDPLNHSGVNQYDADGNLIRVTDRNNRVTQYGYDNRNRRVTVTDALNNVTRTVYDANNNVVSVTDANNHTTSYTYDTANRKLTETYPDAAPSTVSFTYDGVGNVLTKTDQKGQVTSYTYNHLYYLMSRSVPGFPADQYTYDVGGRMLTATRNGWQVTFQYDGVNRVTQTTQGVAPAVSAVGYSYNAVTGVRTVTYPSGRVITETMDLRGRLGTVQDAAGVIASYTYDLGNRVGTRSFPNGVVATYGYNANNWIISLEHMHGGMRVVGFGHEYDNEGNKLYEEKRHNTSRSQAYQYDVINRLTNYRVGTLAGNTIPAPISESVFTLDPVGNWNSKVKDGSTETRTHNAANEILTINSGAVTHDNNGNLTAYSTKTFAYDEANRLVVASAVPSGVLGEYVYDALGRRVIKRASASGTLVETRYLYDGARIIEEQDTSGATLASYAYGNYVDEVLQMLRGTGTYYYQQNSLWHVIAVTDANGALAERYSFDAYGYINITDANGNAIPNNSWGTAHSAIGNPWTYTSRQFDEETGLYYYRARYYDQAKGRFLQRDPIGYVDGMNLYEYVRGNPLVWLDPSGFFGGPAMDYFKNYVPPPAPSQSRWKNEMRVPPEVLRGMLCILRELGINQSERSAFTGVQETANAGRVFSGDLTDETSNVGGEYTAGDILIRRSTNPPSEPITFLPRLVHEGLHASRPGLLALPDAGFDDYPAIASYTGRLEARVSALIMQAQGTVVMEKLCCNFETRHTRKLTVFRWDEILEKCMNRKCHRDCPEGYAELHLAGARQ